MTEQQASELTKLTGDVREITVAGETFKIKPFKIGQLGKVMDLVQHLVQFADADGELNLVEAFAKGSDSVLHLCSIAIGKNREWFDEVDVDEGIALIMLIYEVNRDFFVHRVQPMFQKVAPLLAGQSVLTAQAK